MLKVELQSMNGANHDLVRALKAKVYDLMVKEECLWQQRSLVEWLKVSDLNTSYFHNRANQKNQRNYISKLFLDNGETLEDEHKIGKVFVNYFQTMFQASNTIGLDPILQGIEPKATPKMNAELS